MIISIITGGPEEKIEDAEDVGTVVEEEKQKRPNKFPQYMVPLTPKGLEKESGYRFQNLTLDEENLTESLSESKERNSTLTGILSNTLKCVYNLVKNMPLSFLRPTAKCNAHYFQMTA